MHWRGKRHGVSERTSTLQVMNTISDGSNDHDRSRYEYYNTSNVECFNRNFSAFAVLICSLLSLYVLESKFSIISSSPHEEIMQRYDRYKRTTSEANEKMMSQLSLNVDGEKRVKKALIPLFELQKKGKELNAPILTRWLGKGVNQFMSITTDTRKLESWRKEIEHRKDNERVTQWYNLRSRTKDFKDKKSTEGEAGILYHSFEDKNVEKLREVTRDIREDQPPLLNSEVDFDAPTKLSGNFSTVVREPTIGTHNPYSDAIFAFAEGYDLRIYLGLVGSLKSTNFSGDLVLSISALDRLQPGVEKYLRSRNDKGDINLVVYSIPWVCYDGKGNVSKGTNEGIHKCKLDGMYGVRQEKGTMKALPDPRKARPVATARYELYWAWSLHYNEDKWMLLIDSRDTFFQTDPFKNIERRHTEDRESSTIIKEGILYFFAENSEINTIGSSSFNRNWLVTAYGLDTVSSHFSSPILCSGTTMGERIAIESYLRAMVAQFDETQCMVKGCDQGFHNYLYHSKLLQRTKGVGKIVIYEQGKGIINNLGLLRTKPLRDWGLFDVESGKVLNWNGSLSAVVHQFDRDDELNKYVKEERKIFEKEWEKNIQMNATE